MLVEKFTDELNTIIKERKALKSIFETKGKEAATDIDSIVLDIPSNVEEIYEEELVWPIRKKNRCQEINDENVNEIHDFYMSHEVSETCKKFNISSPTMYKSFKKYGLCNKDGRKHTSANDEACIKAYWMLVHGASYRQVGEEIGFSRGSVGRIAKRGYDLLVAKKKAVA